MSKTCANLVSFEFKGKAYVKGVYANDDEYFADVAKAYQTELKILYDHGLRNGQVDDPNLACSCFEEKCLESKSIDANCSDRFLFRSHVGGLEE